jgi:dihydrofolate reductase
MHIALADVISLDGKIAKADRGPVRDWASKEDGVLLTQLISHFEVIVIGRTTYEQHKPGLSQDRLYVVLTHNPERFSKDEVADQREFSQDSPKELVRKLEKRGYESILLLSGTAISTAFLGAGFVNELYLTIEPRIFGSGIPMIEAKNLDIQCRLDSVARLNDQGTLLAHYLLSPEEQS